LRLDPDLSAGAVGCCARESRALDRPTFDSAGKLVNAQLNAQRQFAKQMAASGAVATRTAQAGAAQVTEALWGGSVL